MMSLRLKFILPQFLTITEDFGIQLSRCDMVVKTKKMHIMHILCTLVSVRYLIVPCTVMDHLRLS